MSRDVVKEDVPHFLKRVGDRVIAGSNNTLIILGTDRTEGFETGLGHIDASGGGRGTGTIHMIVGRSGNDPQLGTDRAYTYMSMKTNIDTNMGLDTVEGSLIEKSAFGVKADGVRIVARDDVKIISEKSESYVVIKADGTIVIEGRDIKLGKTAFEKVIRGNSYLTAESAYIGQITSFAAAVLAFATAVAALPAHIPVQSVAGTVGSSASALIVGGSTFSSAAQNALSKKKVLVE